MRGDHRHRTVADQRAKHAHHPRSGCAIVFGGLTWLYFRFFGYTSALQTALIFTGLAIFLDATVIALLVEKSYAMFGSILGTWIPFGLIFLATYLVGRSLTSKAIANLEKAPGNPAPGAGS